MLVQRANHSLLMKHTPFRPANILDLSPTPLELKVVRNFGRNTNIYKIRKFRRLALTLELSIYDLFNLRSMFKKEFIVRVGPCTTRNNKNLRYIVLEIS